MWQTVAIGKAFLLSKTKILKNEKHSSHSNSNAVATTYSALVVGTKGSRRDDGNTAVFTLSD